MSPGGDEALLRAAQRKGFISEEQLRSCLNQPSPVQAALDSRILSEDDIDGLKLMGSFSEDSDLIERIPTSFNPGYWDDLKGKRFGRYELVSRIGEGATALVIRARDPGLGRDVALKILKASGTATPETVDRFLREARAMAKLRHPHIIAVHEVGYEQGWYFLAMEYVSGTSFDQALQERRLGMDTILSIMEKVAHACHFAHQQGVIHRDLKPENILLDELLNPFLTDFGLARLEAEGKGLTQTGTVMGTPMYMSPEHLTGRSELVNAQSDVYSLGVILYEAATGKLPFDGDSISAVYAAIQTFEPVRPRGINARVGRDLEAVIVKAMERDPHLRYSDAGALANDLSNLRQGLAVHATQVSTLRFTMRRLRRHAAVFATAAALTLVALFALLAFRSHAEREKDALQAMSDAIVRTTRAIEQYDLSMVLPPTDLSVKHQELDNCIRTLSTAGSDPRVSDRTELFFELGRALHRRMRYEEAVGAFDRVLAIRADHALARFDRARTLIDDYLDRLRELPSGASPEYRNIIERQNRPLLEKALEDLKLASDPRILSSLQVDYAQAILLALQGDSGKAIRRFEALLARLDAGKDPKLYGDVQLSLGSVYYRQGRLDDAVATYRTALRVQQSSLDLLLSCGVTVHLRAASADRSAEERIRGMDEAEDLFRKAMKIAPDSYRVYNNYANLLSNRLRASEPLDADLYARAMAHYDTAIKLAANPALPISNRGDLLYYRLDKEVWSGSFDEKAAQVAIEELREVCRNNPHFILGRAVLSSLLGTHLEFLARKGRWDETEYAEAIALAKTGIELDPRSMNCHHKLVQLGMIKLEHLQSRGAFDESTYEMVMKHARHESELAPRDPVAVHAVTVAATLKLRGANQTGDSDDKLWNEALQYAREALRIDPNFKPALLSIGNLMIYRADQRITSTLLKEGEQSLRKLVELDPKYSIGWNSLGNVHYRRFTRYGSGPDDPSADEALRAFDQALSIYPRYVEPTNNKGAVYLTKFLRALERKEYRQSDLDLANEQFAKTIELDPKYSTAFLNRAVINERAAYFLDRQGQDPAVPLTVSLESFEQYFQIVPENIDIRFRYGRLLTFRALRSAGVDVRQAETQLAQVLARNKSHAGAYLERGRLRHYLKRYKEALEDLETAVDLAPGHSAEAEPLIQSCKRELKSEY